MIATVDVSPPAELGESPVWDAATETLLWTDIASPRLFRLAAGECVEQRLSEPVTALALGAGGRLIAARYRGFATVDPATGTVSGLGEELVEAADMRMNDGACDAAGRFWAGSMATAEDPYRGALWRLDPDGTVTRQLDGVTVSNGIGWSPGGGEMYYVDSFERRLDRFDYDPAAGAIANRRTLARMPPDAGLPDGLAVDREGFVWVAMYGGAALRRYAPDGTLERVVELPAAYVTSCAFGGPDLDLLYVTTAGDHGGGNGRGGRLLRVEAPVPGLPANRCGGVYV